MTGDELDRAIQFLVESQAKLTSDIDRLTGEVAQVTGDVNRLTGDATQVRVDLTDLKRVVAQFAANTALWAEESDGRMRRLETAMAELAKRTDEGAERMNALIRVVEGHVTDETRHRPRPG